MKISILLPYKEDYSSKYAGAVSIHVSNLYNYSKFKSNISIYGNTNNPKYLSSNFKNIRIKTNVLTSSNKKYLNKFIAIQQISEPDIIEIHNRPNYVETIASKLKSKIILYFHNNPLTIAGSKTLNERIYLLNKSEFIFFNSNWTKNQFFKDLNEVNYIKKFGVCYQSTKKAKVNLNKKKKYYYFCW